MPDKDHKELVTFDQTNAEDYASSYAAAASACQRGGGT